MQLLRGIDGAADVNADQVAGRIVLWDVPFTSYGETVAYRFAGPTVAAELGAVAVLIRSVTPTSLQTPHTGATRSGEARYQFSMPVSTPGRDHSRT